jgi:hypothetical protein
MAKSAKPTIDLDAASDTGASSTDNITNEVKPTLTGHAQAHAKVTIADGGHVLGTTTTDKTGHWSFTATPIGQGVHHLTAVTGSGHQQHRSDVLDVTIDTTRPAKTSIDLAASSDSGSSSADNMTADTTPTLTGTAEKNATISIKDGHHLLGTTIADAHGHWSFTSSALADGDHSLKAVVTDIAGNHSKASHALHVSIDTSAPPAPTIDLDSGSDTGSSSTDHITSDSTPTLTGSAEVGTIVTIKDGTTTLGTATVNGLGAWSFTTQGLTDGDHSLTAVAVDAAGNTSSQAVLAVTVDTHTAAPTIALDPDSDTDDPATLSDNITADATPTLTGTAEAGATITIKDGATTLGTATADNAGAWSFTTGSLGDGDHSLTALATDVAGNNSSLATLAVTIDTQIAAPTLSLVNDDGTAGDHLTTDATIGGHTEAGATVVIYLDASPFEQTEVTADGSGNWSYTPDPALSPGDHSFKVVARDLAGNVSGDSPTLDMTLSSHVVFDLSALPQSQGFIIQGDAAGDLAGSSVSSAGDVNGDGFDDLIVGAFFGHDGGVTAGQAYVVFGTASGFGTEDGSGRQVVDLTTLTAAQGFVIQGDTAYDQAGYSVSTAGDVNGDGFDDLIVGANQGGDGGNNAGEAYIVFGTASGFGTAVVTGGISRQVIDLTTLTAAQGFVIQGDDAYDRAGNSVSSAGDVNGDGFDDLIVGARTGSDGGTIAGEAYVVFGTTSGFGTADGAGRHVIDLTTLSAAQGFIIQGDTSGDLAGQSVSSAGDINGDGFDDLIVGALDGDDGGSSAGEAYVVFGTASGFGTAVVTGGISRQVIDLTDLSAAQGFIIQGDTADDYAGCSVSSAGDINGDGFDDLIVGASGGDDGGGGAGEAYVVFGTASGFGTPVVTGGVSRQVVDLTTLSAAQGFIIQGDTAGDNAGCSVSSAGDVNGDGFDDLIVGSRYGDDGGTDAGEAYVVFGTASGFGTAVVTGGFSRQVVDLSTLTAAQGFMIQGDMAYDYAGCSVSSAGDVNGDGFDDLIVGAYGNGGGGNSAGAAYVLYGSAFGGLSTTITRTGTSAAETLIGGNNDDTLAGGGGADVLIGGAGNDVIGVTGTDFVRIDGGRGYDTLRMDGASDVFDFAAIRKTAIHSIEAIDMGQSGNQEIDLAKHDVFHLSDDTSGGITRLTVHGAFGDTVSTSDSGWTAHGTTTIGSDTFRIFDNGHAELLIDSDIFLGGGLV